MKNNKYYALLKIEQLNCLKLIKILKIGGMLACPSDAVWRKINESIIDETRE